ncbi:MAG: HNH endonuclease [Lentisphaeria bacterium]|nr:HNH endonuclease [Lentisphaeria bacterium]
MDDWVEINRDERHIKRERAKAREMRQTPYYQELFRKGICHYCKQKFPQEQLTLDHIVPVSRGGRSTRGNLVVACLDCNQKKKYLTPVEMLLRQLDEGNPDD